MEDKKNLILSLAAIFVVNLIMFFLVISVPTSNELSQISHKEQINSWEQLYRTR